MAYPKKIEASVRDAANFSFGLVGAITTNTGTHEGSFVAIQALEEVVLETVVEFNGTPNALDAATIAAGTIIYGNFSLITITSGLCRIYRGA